MNTQTNNKTLSWKDIQSKSTSMDCDQLANYVLSNYKNVGIQQYNGNMLFSINNPSIVRDGINQEQNKNQSYAQLNRNVKRLMNIDSKYLTDDLVDLSVVDMSSASFTFNIRTKTVEHKFLRPSRVLDHQDNAHFDMKAEDRVKTNTNYIRVESVPYGLLFQAVCVEGLWMLASPNTCYLNDKTFGSDCTVFNKFEGMLKGKGLSLNSLDINKVYTFIMGCNEFSLFPLTNEYLLLKNVYSLDKNTTDMTEHLEHFKALRDTRLKPFRINLNDKKYNTVQQILKTYRSKTFNNLLDDLPILYFVIYHNTSFEVTTPLFNKLWKYYIYEKPDNNLSNKDKFSEYIKTTYKTDLHLLAYLKTLAKAPKKSKPVKKTEEVKNQ